MESAEAYSITIATEKEKRNWAWTVPSLATVLCSHLPLAKFSSKARTC